MRYQGRRIRVLAVLAVLALVLVWTVPGEAKKMPQADRLLSQIRSHLDQDQELEACRLAVKMAEYSETKAYAEAKKLLRARGISIEDPLLSWTAKAIVRAQNIAERELLVEGDLKHIGVLPDHKDAWGTPLRIEMVETGPYIYMVRSAGPDKKYGTGDDPLVGGLKPKSGKSGSGAGGQAQASEQANKNSKTKSTLKSLLKPGGSSSGGGSGSGGGGSASGSSPAPEAGDDAQPQEEVVDLGDLIDKTD